MSAEPRGEEKSSGNAGLDVDLEMRKGKTFAQAEGAAPLPKQLALREISQECSAALWAMVLDSFERSRHVPEMAYGADAVIVGEWRDIMYVWHISHEHKYADEFSNTYATQFRVIKDLVTSKDYLRVFTFLQFVIQYPTAPRKLKGNIETALRMSRAAYRVIDDLIVPITSDGQAEAVQAAFALAAGAEARGPYAHLRAASTELSAGRWAESVRESINAVEAAAKSIEPEARTLGPALTKLQASIGLPAALNKAFGALYGYTSGENGVRHALVFEGKSDINERDALFMFGACASFVAYLLSATSDAVSNRENQTQRREQSR